jgi:hypothetical protein
MNDYLVTVQVVKATGWQQYLVRDAKSKADALARFRNGECEFREEELRVAKIDAGKADAVEYLID